VANYATKTFIYISGMFVMWLTMPLRLLSKFVSLCNDDILVFDCVRLLLLHFLAVAKLFIVYAACCLGEEKRAQIIKRYFIVHI
jgi:hypothetical protein